MSNPYLPNQQPPYGSGNGGGAPVPGNLPYGSAYGQQPTQELPAAGGQPYGSAYGQQPTQELPTAGRYGYGQAGMGQGQASYYGVPGTYPQGQAYPVGPYGMGAGQPPNKGAKTGLIIGIIAAVLAVILVIVIAVALTRSNSNTSSPSPTTSSSPSSDPSSSDPGAHPSAGPSTGPTNAPSTGPGKTPSPQPSGPQGFSSDLSAAEQNGIRNECKAALEQSVSSGTLHWESMQRDGTDEDGNPTYTGKGQLEGTLLTGRTGTFTVTCSVVYYADTGAYEAWANLDSQ